MLIWSGRTPTEEEISLNQIEAFDALYASLTQENSELNDAERRNLIDSYAKKASLSCYAQDPFNKALVDKYIATYSIEAFVEKLYTIYDEEYFRWDCTVYGGEIKCEYPGRFLSHPNVLSVHPYLTVKQQYITYDLPGYWYVPYGCSVNVTGCYDHL